MNQTTLSTHSFERSSSGPPALSLSLGFGSTVARGVSLLYLLLAGCAAPRALLDWEAGLDDASALKVSARGVHVYVCSPPADGEGSHKWRLKGVEADLFDAAGRIVGKQLSQASWEAADKSKVTGTMIEKTRAPSCGAVPWILYEAQSTSTRGLFANMSHVQRIFTSGGKAPSKRCRESSIGSEVRVPFSATYYFHVGGKDPGNALAFTWP